jgi:hypothetical protein
MKVEGFALLALVLLCPLTMGVMMFLMMRGDAWPACPAPGRGGLA